MKLFTIKILMFSLVSLFVFNNESDKDLIMNTMYDYIEKWEVNIQKKYYNNDFLTDIKLTEESYCFFGDSVKSGVYGNQYISDSLIIVEGYKFRYPDIKETLQYTNKTKLETKPKQWKYGDCKASFSYPIISDDGQNALIYLNTYCDPLSGSVELFILEKKGGEWKVINRIIKSVS